MRPSRPLLLPALLLACGGSGPAQEPQAGSPAPNEPMPTQGPEHEAPAPLPTGAALAALPPDGGPEFNRLVFEASPYLRQHARNPVDWYPWGDEAFAHAKELDRPIFLSIGYATCHWCHVMEHESFEDPEVAKVLNASFVCIKVDREERPDLDHVYMQVTQAMTGGGGWPMTVFLTPTGEPFYAATYIPKDSRFGRPGLMDLLPRIATAWHDERDGIVSDAKRITDWLRQQVASQAGGELDAGVLAAGARQLVGSFDAKNGGFGTAPKFPMPHALLWLLRWSERSGDAEARRVATATLTAMRRGGIYDQVGFGFHRYSTDARWFLPHFEKMLYDQALHVMAYTAAWQATGEEDFRRTAEEVITYVLRDMTDPAGGFYSAEDADSEGEEGLFYTWTRAEILAALGQEEGTLFADVYGATDAGNFRDEAKGTATGRNVLFLARSLDAEAKARGLEPAALAARLEASRAKLFAVRAKRVRPALDDKVLTDWNGLMIAALARAGRAFGDARDVKAAERAADFVLRELRGEDGRLRKRWRAGQVGMPATLEDHAFLAWGLVELYQADFDPRWLRAARAIADQMVAHFHDAEGGGFYLTADDGAALLVRAKDTYDGAIPSGTAVAAHVLLQLAHLTGDESLSAVADDTLRSAAVDAASAPSAHTFLLQALDVALGGDVEVVVAGDPGAPETQALLDAVRRPFLPNAVTVLRPDGDDPGLAELVPFAAAMGPVDGRPAAYVCRGQACEAPTGDPAELRRELAEAARVGQEGSAKEAGGDSR